ncbi:hypothetical protein C8P66_13825 [Humitalea rosea]|uniref:Uncharacterized protein n=1 Tax=Humitalea rosea TaxID=990373 RepID=A0A2W7IGS9_9PROT|nr:hypothetical protein [Humitalea rosea]PZW37993.1 hypothetical protein C8P66_13825 [Humitalea rosea]
MTTTLAASTAHSGAKSLLFLPLEGAIVAPAGWRRGTATLPRTALAPIAAMVEAALPALWAECATASDDPARAARLGARLWPQAAEVLSGAGLPPGWADTGLRAEDAAPMLALTACVLRGAEALWAALRGDPPDPDSIRAALAPLLAGGTAAFQAGLALLLGRSPAPGTVAAAATGIDPRAAAITEQALDALLERCQVPVLAAETLSGATAAAEGFARLLEDLNAAPAGDRARRRGHLQALRREAQAACQSRFTTALQADLLLPLALGGDALAMEEAARALRRLARAAGRIGDPLPYSRAITGLLGAVAQRPAGLSLMAAARLTEILAGPEAALALLDAG